MDVPSKDDDNDDNINDNNEKIDSELNKISDDDNTHNSKPLSEIDIIKNKVKKHEPLSFQERIALKKNRRENDKERKMNKTREKLENMRQSNVKRQRQTERIQNTKTRKGQPLMGPRINNLLEKIKQNKNN
ncbi:rRNA-processing protein fyv7 [Pichia californica]|nr:rRNA-processing protein fyv7 [[Candida] californica]